MARRKGLMKLAGWSWHCPDCGDFGSDFAAIATSPNGIERCKADAEDQYRAHRERHHGGTP